jgi:hypothetical protein
VSLVDSVIGFTVLLGLQYPWVYSVYFLVLGKAEASAYLAVDSGSSSAFIRIEGEKLI